MNSYWSGLVAPAFDRSRLHTPPDRHSLRAAALDLKSQGLTPRDIATALRLSERAVLELLEVAK